MIINDALPNKLHTPIERPVSNKIDIDLTKPLQNFSFAISNNFYCTIIDNDNTQATFMLQDVTLPSISLQTGEQANQTMGYNTQSNLSDISQSPLELTFVLDEDWTSYAYFWNWKEDVLQKPEFYRKVRLFITNNRKQFQTVFDFTGCHLSDLGGMSLTTKMSDTMPIVFNVTLVYERMWWQKMETY